ncbi:MAG TPA: hypothetical protein VNQ76_04775, partial [Planctomicrobium sp.]|nr:hypothetical protein [Planctomicrobium sp.]
MSRHVWTMLLSGSLLFTGASFEGGRAASAQEPFPLFLFSENGDASDSVFQNSDLEMDAESETLSSRLFLDNTVDETNGTLQLTQYPFESSAATEIVPEEVLSDSDWGPLSYLKQQLDSLPKDRRGLQFKDSSATMTVLPGQGADGFFFSTLDVRTAISPARLPVFRVTPRFGWHLTGGPDMVDVPSQLYDTGVDFSLYAPLSQNLTLYTS